jgi:nitric oxide synthase-interacting protein
MPSKHSKNSHNRYSFSHYEVKKAGHGHIEQRIGADSQLPFGYCALSLYPVDEAVVSPSGHMYSREAILEYLLKKTKELKHLQHQYELQSAKRREEELQRLKDDKSRMAAQFAESQDVTGIAKRKASEIEQERSYMESRKKKIDDTDAAVKKEELKRISPWVVDFTPSADDAEIKEPPKRPSSPFSGRPLRAKDLIPVNLERESEDSSGSSGTVRFICPVSRKTITNQKTVLIKNTGALMLESAYKDLALPTMTCPITGKKFDTSDVIELVSAASGFSASGQVVAKKYRPTIT